MYQLGWTTLPGLRGLSVSDFRAVRTATPDTERGVAVEFTDDVECDAFLQTAKAEFADAVAAPVAVAVNPLGGVRRT